MTPPVVSELSVSERGARAVLWLAALVTAAGLVLAATRGATADQWVSALGAILYLGVGLLGVLIVRRAPRNAVGWLLLASVLGICVSTPLDLVAPSLPDTAAVVSTATVIAALSAAATMLLPTLGLLLFPNGHLPSRRWRVVAWIAMANLAVTVVGSSLASTSAIPGVPNPLAVPGMDVVLLVSVVLFVPIMTVVPVALTARRRRAVDDARRGLLLAEVAAWISAASWWLCAALWATGSMPHWFEAVALQAGLVVPLAAWIGIVRFKLIDVRFAVNRTVLYVALSAIVLGVYAVLAAMLSQLASTWVSSTIAIGAAVVVALPLYSVLQRVINRLVYGTPVDPRLALAQLGASLATAANPDAALSDALETLTGALKLDYAAVTSVGAGLVQAVGRPSDGPPTRIPLLYASREIGTLAIRRDSRRLSPQDLALVERLAPQLAVALHSAQASSALRNSHKQLVAAKDDERRRIRRDLHDGLGPTLAGIVLGLERVERRFDDDPAVARETLHHLHATSQDAVVEVRRLVYAMRPPVLDSLGLAGAIREHAQRLGAADFEEGALPSLSDSVEVATYLIALEAMKNAALHARPGAFWVRLTASDTLELEVDDDGPGLPTGFRSGVGIQSMRERAAELGGTLLLTSRQPHGTRVRASLPVAT